MRIMGVLLVLLLAGCGPERLEEGTSRDEDGLAFEEITAEEIVPEEMASGAVAFLAKDAQQYEEILTLYGLKARDVDFSKKDVLFLSFFTDGCGLVLEDLFIEGEALHVELELPEEYRGQGVVCTTIAKPTTIILETSKMDVTTALFVRSGEQVKVNALLEQKN